MLSCLSTKSSFFPFRNFSLFGLNDVICTVIYRNLHSYTEKSTETRTETQKTHTAPILVIRTENTVVWQAFFHVSDKVSALEPDKSTQTRTKHTHTTKYGL